RCFAGISRADRLELTCRPWLLRTMGNRLFPASGHCPLRPCLGSDPGHGWKRHVLGGQARALSLRRRSTAASTLFASARLGKYSTMTFETRSIFTCSPGIDAFSALSVCSLRRAPAVLFQTTT